MNPPLAHVMGIPVEETLLMFAPVSAAVAAALRFELMRRQCAGTGSHEVDVKVARLETKEVTDSDDVLTGAAPHSRAVRYSLSRRDRHRISIRILAQVPVPSPVSQS